MTIDRQTGVLNVMQCEHSMRTRRVAPTSSVLMRGSLSSCPVALKGDSITGMAGGKVRITTVPKQQINTTCRYQLHWPEGHIPKQLRTSTSRLVSPSYSPPSQVEMA